MHGSVVFANAMSNWERRANNVPETELRLVVESDKLGKVFSRVVWGHPSGALKIRNSCYRNYYRHRARTR